MTIHREKHDKNNPFLMVTKAIINDPILSGKAKAILFYILSKPDNWVPNIKDISAHMRDGIDAVSQGIIELEIRGHILKTPAKNSKGRFDGWEYDIYESPQEDVALVNQVKYASKKPKNAETGKSRFGTEPGFTETGFPGYGESPTTNTDLNNQSFPNGKDLKEKQRELSPPTADDDSPPVNGRFFFDGEEGHGAGKAKDYAAQAAEDLASALQAKGRLIGRRRPHLPSWAKTFREFLASGEVSQEDFEAVLRWYIEHIGERWVPVAEAASTFVEKYVKIRDQME